MSNLFGEARIEILPDTTAFRAALITQIEAAQAGLAVTIPVAAIGAEAANAATGGATAATRAAAAAAKLLEKQELQLAAAEQKALLATTPLGAARQRLAGTAAAAATAEAALEKAMLSGDEALIANAEAVVASTAAEETKARAVARTIILDNAHAKALNTKTTATTASAVATGAEAEALRLKGAAAVRATAQDTALVASTEANIASSARLAGIQEAVSLTTTDLAAKRVVLREVNAAAALSQEALAKAIQTGNAQIIAAQAEITRLVLVTRELAVASVQTAIAEEKEAAAAAESAAAHAQATKGALAQTLSFGGLRAGTLAASRGFLIGTAAVIVLAKSIQEASDETEQFNKVQVVFGQSAKSIEDFAKTTASSLGISNTEALKAAGIFGNLFRTIKISEPVSAHMSERLVRLAADLASFNNADPSRTLEALRSGLVGQARPLRVFGIFLSASRVAAEALIETNKKSVTQLTEAEKVQARYSLILQDSAIAAGDFSNTQSRLANQSRIAKANLLNFAAAIGKNVTPALELAIQDVNDLFNVVQKIRDLKAKITITIEEHLPGGKGGIISRILGQGADLIGPFGVVKLQLKEIHEALKLLGLTTDGTKRKIRDLGGGFSEMSRDAAGSKIVVDALAASLEHAENAAANFGNRLQTRALTLEAGGASLQARIDLQKQIIANDKILVAQARKTGKAGKIQAALQQQIEDQNTLTSLTGEVASNAQEQSSKQKANLQKAAQAQAEATQALIDLFAAKQQRLQNRLTTAQLLGNARAEIAANKRILVADTAEIHALQVFIKQKRLHGDALRTARDEIRRLQQEQFNLRNTIAQLRAERKQADIDARQTHLEAMLSIAETTASTADDARAQRALIAFDNAQIKRITRLKNQGKATREEIAALDAYRVDLAQRRQALKELTAEQKKNNDASAAFQFTFLQTQAGFAANLLGNLIPLGATSGLVGGTTTAAGTATGLRQVPGGFEQPRNVAQTVSAKSATMPSGPSLSGQARQTHLLNQIVHLLSNIYRGTGHPEAHHRRRTNPSAMDLDNHH